MLTHDTIWLAIDRLAQSCGYSTSGLAKRAGLDPTSFNRSKRIGADGKPRWPSTESVSRILEATGATMLEFVQFIDNPVLASRQQTRIPLLSLGQSDIDSFFDDKGNPTGEGWDHIHFPHTAENAGGMYALEVTGSHFLPLFREGDRLIVATDAPIRRGDRVVIKTLNGKIIAKELLRQTATKIELKSFSNGETVLSFAPKEINWIARIVWVSQ